MDPASYLFPLAPWLLAVLIAIPLVLGLIILLVLRKRRRFRARKQRPVKKMIPRLQMGIVHRIGARESQQDSYAVSELVGGKPASPNGFLAVVADGMGGLTHGEDMSSIAAETFLTNFQREESNANPDQLLMEYLADANNRVNQFIQLNGIAQAGTTLVAAIIADKFLHFVSVGDSRVYLLRAGGLIQLNREHSYGAQLDTLAVQGSVKFGHARSDMFRAALTNYLGMGNLEQVDKPANPIRLMRGDRILLASDGIFSALSDAEIADYMQGSALDAAYTLEQAIDTQQRPTQDNYTAILIIYK